MDALQRGPFAFARPEIDVDDDFAWEALGGPGEQKITLKINDLGQQAMPMTLVAGAGGSAPAIQPIVTPAYHQLTSQMPISMPPSWGSESALGPLLSRLDALVSGLSKRASEAQSPLPRSGVRTYSPMG